MTDDTQLLQEYGNGSEAAFRGLVERYINLVYSAAIRHSNDVQMAEDVAQTVFTALARKASALPKDVVLGGWLYRHTCFVAAQAMRTERRRQARETQAVEMNTLNDHAEPDWERLSPFLDEAMQHLETGDRDAVVLRYFEGRNLQSVGTALGVTEEAARKRITRAVEKLRTFFTGRGVTLSATTLATLLAGNAVIAAPAGIAVTISGAALAAAAVSGTGYTITLLKLITMRKLKVGIIGAVVVASVVTPLVLQHQSRVKLREADEISQQQDAQLAKVHAENDRLAGLAVDPNNSKGQAKDLLRLRAEAGSLARQTNNLPKLQKENRRLQAAADKPDVEPTPEQQQEVMTKMNYGKSRFMASARYARTNQGNFPSSFAQLAGFFPDSAKAETDPTGDAFEIVYQGTFKGLGALSNPQNVIVVRQKQPSAYGNRWAKVYGYGDGHFEVHTQADLDFEAWEKQRLFSQASSGQ